MGHKRAAMTGTKERMRGVGLRIVVGGTLLLAALLPARARAVEAALSWVRLEGAATCIAAPALAKLVEERIGRPVLQPPARAEVSIEGRVSPHPDGGWLAIVDVGGADGRLLGRRELRVKDGPCSALDRPLSLIISLIIDRDAAGPGLIDGVGLSADAQQLLAQLDLPSADRDELLAQLAPLSPPASERLTLASDAQASGVQRAPQTAAAQQPQRRMVRIPEAEWQRLKRLQAEDERTGGSEGTPAWPGYALLGLGAVATGLAIYSNLRMRDVQNVPLWREYAVAVGATMPGFADICTAAEQDLRAGFDADDVGAVRDICDEGNTLEVLQWVFAGTALASFGVGAAWLLWIADDDDANASAARTPALSLQPALGRGFGGASLRLRL
jgi:hypothetical protein